MINWLFLPVLLQLASAPDEFFEQEYSAEVSAILSQGDDIDLEAAERELKRLGEQGDDSAYEVLGEIYSFGPFGVTPQPERGCDYFARVADRRPDAQHNLATCYFNGHGRERDLTKARELYLKAAQSGYRQTFCAYGNMLVRGEGGAVEAEEGVQLCRMTAVRGDANAQTDYGTYLLTGQGVERDPVAARFMFELAVTQEQRNAAYLLAQIHTRGDGTPVDHVTATDWFIKAYEWGRRDGAFEAARSYLRRGYISNEDGGATVRPELLREAKVWLNTAIEIEPAGSQRIGQMRELFEATDQLIASAESN